MTINRVKVGGGRLVAGVVAAATLLAGCDVTNPGQILDSDLNNAAAIPVLVTGMAGDFQVGLRDIGWNNAVLVGDRLRPDQIEPMEAMVEGTLYLCDCPADVTGQITVSLDNIEAHGLTVHALDGSAL